MLGLISPTTTDAFFLTDFPACRRATQAAVAALGDLVSAQQSWPVNLAKGTCRDHSATQNANLCCDAYWLGDTTASRVLVLISGTHGVEGYAGSAVQRFVLQALAARDARLPEDTAVLMVHALNPWGMRWARRCDEQGIDTNRNFVDFDKLPEPAAEFPALLKAFEIQDAHERRRELHTLALAWGQRRYEEVLSGGQYQADWAPFYGGRHAGFARRCVEAMTEQWQLADREQVVIDLHTGLGPWGFGELISDHPSGAAANDYAYRLFGPAVACTHDGESYSVPKRGLLDFHWHRMMQARGCFLTLEFGTYGTEALFRVLLDDHRFWLTRDGSTHPDAYSPVQNAMLRHFCPNERFWQQSVLWRGWQVVNRVLEYFAAGSA